jgi:hypothetical protein
MCYNTESSLVSFLITIIGSIYLFRRNEYNDRMFGMIILGIGSMQIGDYLIHNDIDCKNNLNKIGSKFGYISHIMIQPLFSLLGTLLFNSKNIKIEFIYGWLTLCIFYLYISIKDLPNDKLWCSYKNNCNDNNVDCNLIWPWHKKINYYFYGILVFILPILLSDIKNKSKWILYSIFMPEIIKTYFPNTIPSIWCFYGPILTLIIKIFNIF